MEASLGEIMSKETGVRREGSRTYVRLADDSVLMSGVVLGTDNSADGTSSFTDEFRRFVAGRGGLDGVVSAHTHPLQNTEIPGGSAEKPTAGSNLIPSQPTTSPVNIPQGESRYDLDNMLGSLNDSLPSDSPYAGDATVAHIIIDDSGPFRGGAYSVTIVPAESTVRMEFAGRNYVGGLRGYSRWIQRIIKGSSVYKGRIGSGDLRER